MNEIDKMRNSQLADMEKPEIQASFIHAKKLVAQLRMMSTYDDGFREVLEELVPGIPSTSVICPPFYTKNSINIKSKKVLFIFCAI
jgi:maltose O-acetyltransferase